MLSEQPQDRLSFCKPRLAKTCKSQRKIHFFMNCRNLLQTSLSPFLCIIFTYFSYAVGYYFFAASAANASKQAFTSFDSLATETRSFLKCQINWQYLSRYNISSKQFSHLNYSCLRGKISFLQISDDITLQYATYFSYHIRFL